VWSIERGASPDAMRAGSTFAREIRAEAKKAEGGWQAASKPSASALAASTQSLDARSVAATAGSVDALTPLSARNGAAARRGARGRRHRPAQGTPRARAACRVPVVDSPMPSGASRRKPPCGTTMFPSWELGWFETRSTRGVFAFCSEPRQPTWLTPDAQTPAVGRFRFSALFAGILAIWNRAPAALGFERAKSGSERNLKGCARTPEYSDRTLALSGRAP